MRKTDAQPTSPPEGNILAQAKSTPLAPDQESVSPLMTVEERQQLLFAWNDTQVDYPRETCIHALFEDQVTQCPDSVALVSLVSHNEHLTYGELNRRANQLAHYLRAQGAGSESLVGVCMARSPEMMVGLLGVLKAGGGYVPLDPLYPPERLAFMLNDTQARIVLTQARFLDLVSGCLAERDGPTPKIVCLDADWPAMGACRETNPATGADARNLAYVIYTSGSTGRPKGVLISHQALVNHTLSAVHDYDIGAEDRVLQFASISFDASAEEIYPCWLGGGTLVLRPESMIDTLDTFLQACADWRLSVLDLPTAYWHRLCDGLATDGLSLPPSVRLVIIGGERALPDRVAAWRERVDERTVLMNTYGPTEATIVATRCDLTGPAARAGDTGEVPIGRPIRNVQTYVLDHDMRPVPVGTPGELYLGGDGLAQGYLDRSALTATAFVPNPLTEGRREREEEREGGRLYRTGDLVRYLPDGHLEFLGRVDRQVKVRGFRVELGEIEAALDQHPDVSQAFVVARDDAAGALRLVAYVVPVSGDAPPAGTLRDFLRDKLPAYMIPAFFVPLAELPLTPSGKVDRRALPAPDLEAALAGAYVAPRTPAEEIVAGIWGDVLGLERVSVEADFFDLGGHSLSATQIVSRIRRMAKAELSLWQLFESPTVAGLARVLERAQGQRAEMQIPPLEPVERNGTLPLSFAQQRMWFLNQLEPDSPFYNVPSALRLVGALDVSALEKALSEIVRRHEALRTTFAAVDGEPYQVIHPAQSVTLDVTDLTTYPAEEREAEAQRRMQAEAHRPFDLETGPPIRVQLLRLAANDHVLLLNIHHIVSDGWSMDVLAQELRALYGAFVAGEPSPLEELAIQYADYAAWQRAWLAGDALETQVAYWQEQLAGAPALLELPTDRPRPPVQSYRGNRERIELPGELAEGLRALSRRAGTTLFMTLLAAFQALLSRYTGQGDVVVGTPIAGRTRAEVEDLIGFFVNTLALRADLTDDPTFETLLARVREVTLGAYAHQDVPFEKLVEELRPERNLSYSPLFQVVFTLVEASPAAELPGLRLSERPLELETARFDLVLSVEDGERGMQAEVEYNTDLFDAAIIERMLGHFQTLLAGIVADPSQQVSALPLLTMSERETILETWNATVADSPRAICVHEQFEAQVERAPGQVAVAGDGEQLTYRELNERSNRLVHHLRRLGVGPEVMVGICVERSIEMVVGILGILKAGGAYVPLDPAYPPERLAFVLADTRAPVLLTQQRLVKNLPDHDAVVRCLDTDWEMIAAEPADNPACDVTVENLAYVIYTSGSTGRPKGVQVQHGELTNLCAWHRRVYDVTAADQATQLASPAFDASVWEIWPYLTVGASVYVPPETVRLLPQQLLAWLVEHAITISFMPTPLAEVVLETLADGALSDVSGDLALRMLLTGGDRLRHWPRAGLGFQLANNYGPTENTVVTTWTPVRGIERGEDVPGLPPIGRPVDHVRVYVLDSAGQPVPVGVPGELYVGGASLARGYLNQPGLTAAAFVPDPFAWEKVEKEEEREGKRLYRTGDLVRWLPDGRLDFLGRVDTQVKVRGFRIELGEIEAVLGEREDVRDAVVVAAQAGPEGSTGDRRLVAYVVPAGEPSPGADVLQAYLGERLPPYMIPSAFVTLAALPLTPNGKVDRRALPTLNWDTDTTAYVAPRTPVEELVAQVWCDVLGLERVSVEANFFELGGHSLSATQVVSRIGRSMQVDLPLRRLFESPSVAGLARALAQNAQQDAQKETLTPPIEPVSREGNLPLSFAQQRMWFLNQLEPDSPFYNVPFALRLTGELDVDALAQALGEIVRRHEALRTTFAAMAGEPHQVIHPARPVTLDVTDLTAYPAEQREAEARQRAQAEAHRPFDLETGPLVRVRLLRLAANDHVLLLNVHHIVSDGWSMDVLVRELRTLYEAFVTGEPSPLEELAIQYADYAAWQRMWLGGDVLETQVAYWREQLAGAPALLELPTDRPRPPVQSYYGGHQRIELPAELVAGLRDLGRRAGTTLFMTLLAAFQALLSRYTGQRDVVVGSPIAGRTRAEVEDLIGFFVNTLALRIDLSGNPTFEQLLVRVRRVTLEAYAHQDAPFEKLVEELRPERNPSYSPLFQVAFTLIDASPVMELPGLHLSELAFDVEIAKFDLTLTVEQKAEGLIAEIEYNADLFDVATIARMLGHFQTLLKSVVAEPALRLGELPLLTPAERETILTTWNATVIPYPRETCAHELFEAQAAQTPDAVAVIFEDQYLTYRQLDRRANQLARHLRSLGVGPEVLVGLCVERSLEMVVGLLGIMKAGGAYLPLDPAYPPARLAFMLKDARVPVLLTQERLVAGLPEHASRVLRLDADWGAIAAESAGPFDSGATVDNLAYVIYTSGSTGRPKGAQLAHRGLPNVSQTQIRMFGLQPGDHVLQFASLSFDAATFEIFMALRVGAALCLGTPERLLPGPSLIDLLQDLAVSIVTLTPSALASLPALPVEALPHLRTITVAGEACSADLVARWAEGRRFFNLYGPTEATIWTTAAQCVDGDQKPPIGYPIDNTEIYLLDAHLRPVPVGVPGELHVSGVGLARGYLNQPGLTAQAFIPHPFSARPGARLYRTGDLARHLPDGQVEFLGRIDHQVKVRGFRIELGEIEAVLNGHSAVQETVVVVRADGTSQRVVAYVVPMPGQAVSAGDLRDFLGKKLPGHMVPSAFVTLAALPLTPNGKVDRRALPAPDLAAGLEGAYVAPRTPVEELVAQVWCDVLGLERVSVEANFFELGGHSLSATQVVSRICRLMDIDLPLRRLFESPSVAGLARALEQARDAGEKLPIPPIEPASREGALPLSFAQQRMWFLNQLEPDSPFYNVPFALCLTGELDVEALERALGEIVRRHEVLRTTFAAVDGEPHQVIRPARPVTLDPEDLTTYPVEQREAEARRRAQAEAHRSFDLETGPLVRVWLLRLAARDHVLLLNVHHVAADGWSMGILTRELRALYGAFLAGEPSPLEDLAIQYADYAAWQRAWLAGDVLEAQVAYWRDQLAGAPALLELPTDRPRPPVQGYRGGRERIDLPVGLAAKLRKLGRREGTTLFMTLLAAFQALLARYSGQRDIVVGSPIAGRTRAEVEDLIGFFVNTLVLRTDLSGNPTFEELLARVRRVTLEGYAHQDVPFEKLVEELQPERNLSYSPLFQVMFILTVPSVAMELPGLHLSDLPFDVETSKFDLSMFVGNDEDDDGDAGNKNEQNLWVEIEYNVDLFDAATIARMLGHFQTLLEGVAADPARRLNDLSLLTAEERETILTAWNDTAVDYPRDRCLHELFEAQADAAPDAAPDAVAVVFEDQHLTYGALERRANQLAHYLRERGVGPDVPVALCVERSLDVAVGVLGTLKAGGVYVPLDPAYPARRLAFMLRDTGAPVLLAHQRLLDALPEYAGHVLCLDTDRAALAKLPAERISADVTPDHLLYVIYTSGSTGWPKGVAMRHRPLVNLVHWQSDTTTLERPARTFQFSSLSFDVSCQELFFTWHTGGTLLMFTDDVRRDPTALLHALDELWAERLFLPFVALQNLAQVLATYDVGAPAGLREVITAGEQLQATPQMRDLFDRLDGCTLHNQYGPTEAHVVTAFTLTDAPETWTALPPIGTPVANARIYILDETFQPTPVGVPGELYIGGAALARGYLNRPAMTAETFIPDLFSPPSSIPPAKRGLPSSRGEESGGARLYRTGDRARYLPDGTIEFLGRIDQQVKVRGYRIEPGEIEVALAQHPAVREAAVLVVDGGTTGSKQLAAYVTVRDGSRPTAGALRRFLQDRLPDYMVPSACAILDQLPLTPSGKVDRRALAALELARPDSLQDFTPPRTPAEDILAGIWAEVLNVARVGVHDNFFALGGHSLLATQVVSRIRQAMAVELPLRSLFEAATVAELAEQVTSCRETTQPGAPIEPVARDGALPLSFAQQRLWFVDRWETGNPYYNIPMGMRIHGPLDADALRRSLNEILRRHEVLRSAFREEGGQPRQVILPEVTIDLPAVDLRELPEAEREAEARQQVQEAVYRPFDLETGPLVRGRLWQLGAQDHVLLLNVHHIVSDGWSMDVLARELSALYGAFIAGEPSPLEELVIQYADYAGWQRAWLAGDVLEAQTAYWREQLAGAPALLELPTDRPRPPVQGYRGGRRWLTLSDDLAEGLRALSRREGATMFMTLLAAFQALLSRYTGQRDVVVGSPIAGRTRAEVEDLIGFFVNTLALRTDLSGDPTFRELLARVREMTLEAYAHQDVPFEKLVEELQPARNLSYTPLFQVMFTLQDAPPVAELPGLQLDDLPFEFAISKFDLTLGIEDGGSGLVAELEYNADLFDGTSIERMLGHLQTLLEGIVADPALQLGDLPLLTPAERETILEAWNGTATDYDRETCVPALFEAQAARTPDAVAVDGPDGHLTYAALARRANRLAHYLVTRGVGPETTVGVCMTRRAEMVLGLLAVLQAGGAYVPLDPVYPTERMGLMLADCGARVVLTETALVERLPATEAHVIDLDGDWAAAGEGSASPPDPVPSVKEGLAAKNLAYVIYTSGSTGRPKGVQVEHGGLVNLCAWHRRAYGVTAADRATQLASPAFDASVWEIWPYLSTGASLHVPPDAVRLSPQRLLDWLAARAITISFLPTPLAEAVLDTLDVENGAGAEAEAGT
ncbi:MAG TPA: amino acid adenylation domain-containing protein, partial [Chloroflexi bacterium]|nr:amino acid adenylation domain-containing protein [Chloroflexota bacterium]